MTFAIASNGRIHLWCKGTARRFVVINGAWKGSIQNNLITVNGWPKEKYPGEVVWSGEVPLPHGQNYNDAIAWLNEHVAYPARAFENRS